MIEFDSVPIVAPSLRFARVADDAAVLLGDRQHHLLQTRELVEVLTWIDGCRTKQEVLLAAGARVGDVPALVAFEQLASAGHLVAAPPTLAPAALAFWHAHGICDPSAALARLSGAVVEVCGRDAALVAETRQALNGAGLKSCAVDVGIALERSDPSPTLLLCVVDDYLRPELEAINRAQLRAGAAWGLVNPTRATPFVGPVFAPGVGPCWECLAYWLRANRPVCEFLRETAGQREPVSMPPASLAASRQVALSLMALSLARHVATAPAATPLCDHILAFDPTALQLRPHFVQRRPQCPVCGDASLMAAQMQRPIELQAIAKCRPHLGGYRRARAEDTFARFAHLIDPYVGAATFVSSAARAGSTRAPVFVSGYAIPVHDARELDTCVRLCAGKGQSEAQARTSALCEALERRSGVYIGDEARIRATAQELGAAALLPQMLDGFSRRQYAQRAETNARASDPALWVPEPLAPTTVIDWVPGWSLTHQRRRYVPLAHCFSCSPRDSGTDYSRPCGNGVGAGTCLEEAILQGLLELVERDAIAIWWYNQIQRPSISPAGLPAPVAALLDDYRCDGSDAWLLDLTHDLAIPTCVAVGRRRASEHADAVYSTGFGCHLDPVIAAERALTELHQLGDGRNPGTGLPFLATARMADTAFLTPSPQTPLDYAAQSICEAEHLRADIEACIAKLALHDLEVVVVDKTRPDVGLHVAQVIVPGLRHMRPRLGPGRIYDVPVRLGWLAAPNTEDALNAVPLVL